jgi:hypothetical protein
MRPTPYNFIVARFGDNDFGHTIKEALIEGVDYWGLDTKACPIIWKRFILAYLTGYMMKRRAVDPVGEVSDDTAFWKSLPINNNYFQKLRVTFDVVAPTDDHDGGSAAYDLNRKYAWTF